MVKSVPMTDFWIPFGIILVTEIADKSRIAGFLLATTFRAPAQVFWGMTLAYALLEGIAVAVGSFIPAIVPMVWIKGAAACVFILVGLVAWFMGEEVEEYAKKWIEKIGHHGAFLVSFIVVALSEIGDRTQIAASALSAQSRNPMTVYAGAMSALILLNIVTVWAGDRLAGKFSQKIVHRVAALVFIFAGLIMLGRIFLAFSVILSKPEIKIPHILIPS